MEIKTIIVDDEPSARSNLRNKLALIDPNICVVAEAASVKEAKNAVVQFRPDLVFLDITLPEEYVGVVMVFRTFEKVSYALVMETQGAVHVADTVRSL